MRWLLQPVGGTALGFREVNPLTRCGPRRPQRRALPFAVDSFRLHTTERDGCAVLAVAGEVDLSNAPQFREALIAMVAHGHRLVVVDLSETGFLDSTGLGALVAGLKRVRAIGGEMRVVCTSPRVCKVFEITSLDRVLHLYDSLDEACKAD